MARNSRNRRARREANAVSGMPEIVASAGNPAAFDANRAVSIRIVSPSQVYSGRYQNPDPVIQQYGQRSIWFYERQLRQFSTLYGVCSVWADAVCSIDAGLKAGDETEGKSRELRDQIWTTYKKLPDLHILNKKMAFGRFFGFAATGKAGWDVDEETGLTVPKDLYDIPQKYLTFGPNGETFILGENSTTNGVPLPDPKSIFFYRWGSRFTPWGEADLRYCYLTLWYLQQVREFGMQALELLGRPIPWIEVPETIVGDEYAALEAGLAAQYKYYVITRTSASRSTVTFPSLNVLANGAAGKSELDYIRFLYGEIYIALLGVQLTQDKTSGSRALEETRMEVVSDKTPPGRQALDAAWTDGYVNHICEINRPDYPRQWWPKFDSDTSKPALVAGQITAVVDIATKLATGAIAPIAAKRTLMLAGVPETWANDIVSATVDMEAVEVPEMPEPSPEPQENANAA